MSSDGDVVLSEVHIGKATNEEAITRFWLHLPVEETHTQHSHEEKDEDEDLAPPRRRGPSTEDVEVVTIAHKLATEIAHVGLQVWKGSLLLTDFVVSHWDLFQGRVVVELGAGMGLPGLVASRVAQTVFLTDCVEEVLELCQHNVTRNAPFLDPLGQRSNVARVRRLDWEEEISTCPDDPFAWSVEDRRLFERATVFLAADVIYDTHLTNHLFNKLRDILASTPHAVVYMALEKRINFCVEFLEPRATSYDTFLHQLNTRSAEGCLHGRCLDLDFPQSVELDRPPHVMDRRHMELWEITHS